MTVSGEVAGPVSTGAARGQGPTTWLRRAVVSAPDAILIVFGSACFAVTAALTLRTFTPWLVIPLFVVSVAALARWVPSPPPGRGQAAGSVISMAGAFVWFVLNVPYAAQLLRVGRDPAIYTLTGIWLGDHRSPDIDARDMLALQDQVSGTSAGLVPYLPDADGIMHGQGGVALPGLLGVGHWVNGVTGVLTTNLLVGSVALIGIYALARRFVRPWLALAVQWTLGAAVPFLYLMRAPYSESVMLVAGMAALVWIVAALAEDRSSLAVVGGILLGVASMARVDGPMVLAGAGALVAVLGVVAREGDIRRHGRIGVVFLAAALSSSLFGLLSLYVTENRYLHDVQHQALLLWVAAVVALVVALLVIALRLLVGSRSLSRGFGDRTLQRAGLILGSAVPLVFLVWGSRPLWWEAHFVPAGTPYYDMIEGLQRLDGLPVDGSRSYDELTVHWVAWYFGWGTVVLASLGLGVMLWAGIARRRPDLLVLVIPTAVAAMLYFNKVSITPDQIWAYRRLLPVITPGLLVGAAVALEWLLRRHTIGRGPRAGIVLVGVLLIAGAPLLAWSPLNGIPEGQGNRRLVARICGQLTGGPVLIASGRAPETTAFTVRVACGREVITGPATDAAMVRELESRFGHLQVIAFAEEDLPQGSRIGKPSVVGRVKFWERTLVRIPDKHDVEVSSVWIGRLVDGRFIQNRLRAGSGPTP